MIAEVAYELSILAPSQISSLHLGTKILSQLSGIGYFDSLSLINPPEVSRGIKVSGYLGNSPGNTKVFLYNTRDISAGVSTSLSSYSFSWKFFTRGTWYAVSLFEYI